MPWPKTKLRDMIRTRRLFGNISSNECVQAKLILCAVSSVQGRWRHYKVAQQVSAMPVETWHSGCTVCEPFSPSSWTLALCRGISISCDCSLSWYSSSHWIRHSQSRNIEVYQKLQILGWGKWEIHDIEWFGLERVLKKLSGFQLPLPWVGTLWAWPYIETMFTVFMSLVFFKQPRGNPFSYASEYFLWIHLFLFL